MQRSELLKIAHFSIDSDFKRQSLVFLRFLPILNGQVGSLLLASGHSVEEVQKWCHNDPYYTAGVFDSVCVCMNVCFFFPFHMYLLGTSSQA